MPSTATRTPDGGRQLSRSRLPLPPVPAATRSAGKAGARAAAPVRTVAPETSVAPFQAVPTPEPRVEPHDDDLHAAARSLAPRGDLLERPAPAQAAPPALPHSGRAWAAEEPSLSSTGPAGLRSGPPPRIPTQTTAGGSSGSAYGDWTKPSRSGDGASATDPELLPEPLAGGRGAPGTTLIPERSVRRGRDAEEPAALDDAEEQPAPVHGPRTGGRAALRAERQAADAARRKAEKRTGSAVGVLDDDEPHRPRRILKGLVAMTVVALGVLGVYSFVSPRTAETAAQTPATSAASAPVASEPSLPALPTMPPVDLEPIAVAPAKAPVTVLNSTGITGLAAKVAGNIAAGGWETPGVGAYPGSDVAASTVFYTEGDENQRLAAESLVEQFPQLQGPTPRFFEVPADVQAPGLVVVLTGDWQP